MTMKSRQLTGKESSVGDLDMFTVSIGAARCPPARSSMEEEKVKSGRGSEEGLGNLIYIFIPQHLQANLKI